MIFPSVNFSRVLDMFTSALSTLAKAAASVLSGNDDNLTWLERDEGNVAQTLDKRVLVVSSATEECSVPFATEKLLQTSQMVLSVVIPTFVVVSADIASSKQAGLNHLYFPRFPEGMRKTVLVGVEQTIAKPIISDGRYLWLNTKIHKLLAVLGHTFMPKPSEFFISSSPLIRATGACQKKPLDARVMIPSSDEQQSFVPQILEDNEKAPLSEPSSPLLPTTEQEPRDEDTDTVPVPSIPDSDKEDEIFVYSRNLDSTPAALHQLEIEEPQPPDDVACSMTSLEGNDEFTNEHTGAAPSPPDPQFFEETHYTIFTGAPSESPDGGGRAECETLDMSFKTTFQERHSQSTTSDFDTGALLHELPIIDGPLQQDPGVAHTQELFSRGARFVHDSEAAVSISPDVCGEISPFPDKEANRQDDDVEFPLFDAGQDRAVSATGCSDSPTAIPTVPALESSNELMVVLEPRPLDINLPKVAVSSWKPLLKKEGKENAGDDVELDENHHIPKSNGFDGQFWMTDESTASRIPKPFSGKSSYPSLGHDLASFDKSPDEISVTYGAAASANLPIMPYRTEKKPLLPQAPLSPPAGPATHDSSIGLSSNSTLRGTRDMRSSSPLNLSHIWASHPSSHTITFDPDAMPSSPCSRLNANATPFIPVANTEPRSHLNPRAPDFVPARAFQSSRLNPEAAPFVPRRPPPRYNSVPVNDEARGFVPRSGSIPWMYPF